MLTSGGASAQREAGSRLHKASDFLSAAELAGLHSEQRSLVDFLVVLRSEVCAATRPAMKHTSVMPAASI